MGRPLPQLLEFTDYRAFLERNLTERGRKKQLADFIPCQSTFLSNVISGIANLSLEHAIRVVEFLELSEIESHYFMLIVQYGKAGTHTLQNYYLRQIEVIRRDSQRVSKRISSHGEISFQSQAKFYNSWLYVAIHILVAIDGLQTRRALRDYLKISAAKLEPMIDFMISEGVISEKSGALKQGATRFHLPDSSPFLAKHHINWRMKAIQDLDEVPEQSLHYTMVMSLSKKDVERMRNILLESISRTDQLLKETGDETVYSFCMDWFKV